MFRLRTSKFFCRALCIGLLSCQFGFSAAAPRASVPLRILSSGLASIPVTIDGEGPFQFLVDTGTNTTLIAPELAARLGLRPVGAKYLATVTGTAAVKQYSLDRLCIGDEPLKYLEALTQPMAALRAFGPEIQGVLGTDVLRFFSFRVDYERQRFDLFYPRELPPTTSGTRVHAKFSGDTILVRVDSKSAPGGSWKFALDSGATQVYVFEDRLLEDSGCSSRRIESAFVSERNSDCGLASMRVITNFSERTVLMMNVRDLSVGGVLIGDQPMAVLQRGAAGSKSGEDGLLPSSLFRVVVFDRATSIVIFNPD